MRIWYQCKIFNVMGLSKLEHIPDVAVDEDLDCMMFMIENTEVEVLSLK